jgi:ferredoxin-like protein FixX
VIFNLIFRFFFFFFFFHFADGYNANWATGNWFLWTVTFPTANSFQLCAARFLQATNTWAEADISAQYEVATTTCAAGQYINSNFLCTACPVGKYSSSSGLTACSTCGSNQIVNLASSACIASCPAGQFNTNGIFIESKFSMFHVTRLSNLL